MVRDKEHLQLLKCQPDKPRRKKTPNIKAVPRENRKTHGQSLLNQVEQLEEHFYARINTYPSGMNPKLIFKLKINKDGSLDETKLDSLDLHLLAKDPSGAIVVFPSEAKLKELQKRISDYSGLTEGAKNDFIASIDGISELTPEDRIGNRLKEAPLKTDEIAFLDIELWHTGNNKDCNQKINEIEKYLQSNNLTITDRWIGQSLCLVRAKVNIKVLPNLLQLDYVKEIDRRPKPSFEMVDLIQLGFSGLNIEENPSSDLIGVLIIDSGVMQGHPILKSSIGDTQVFLDRNQQIKGGAEDGDQRTGGHGTAVAGIAVYGDIGECISNRTFAPSAQLFSARVTDENNEYNETELIEHQLEKAITYFLENYKNIRVINISLGDDKLVYCDEGYQYRLAAAIDDLIYRYRDQEIIFTVSAGNIYPNHLQSEEIIAQYPKYLFEKAARIINPATAALAITVGGLSYGAGKSYNKSIEQGTERLIAQEKYFPSPFTRTGLGVDNAIKPEVVDFAGDLFFERGRITTNPKGAGLPTTAKDITEGKLFRTVSGTSFASPKVANLAAQLFKEFPESSSNLIRALIADSARVPINRPNHLLNKDIWDKDILRIYGYGQPNFYRARKSASNEVLLMADDQIELDSFCLYKIPPLPEDFLKTKGKKYICVTLAFDPPTRHTRGDSYLGAIMEFKLFRNVDSQQLANAIRVWSTEEKQSLEDYLEKTQIPALKDLSKNALKMKPSSNKRKTSTLQKAILEIYGSNWKYDGNDILLALTCQRKWAPLDIARQRFAVVVSITHENAFVDIYSQILQQTRVYERIRLKT